MEDKQIEELNQLEERRKEESAETVKKMAPKGLKIVAMVVAILAVISVIMAFLTREDIQKESYSFRIEKIAELTTLKCYYHNVAVYESENKGWFSWNDEKAWIEYDGIIDQPSERLIVDVDFLRESVAS